jgi:hypothetical protein
MWNQKLFKSAAKAQAWMDANASRYQMTLIFIHDGYAVEYKKLLRVY